MSKKTKPEKRSYMIEFILYNVTPKRIDKFIDHMFKKPWGARIGVASTVPVPEDYFDNAAERALDRIKTGTLPHAHRDLAYSHGYRAAMRTAQHILTEELARHHGK